MCAEDLNTTRTQVMDDDDDDHDDHDDSDKINDTEGLDPERLKAFNVRRFFRNLFLITYIFAGSLFMYHYWISCISSLCTFTSFNQ